MEAKIDTKKPEMIVFFPYVFKRIGLVLALVSLLLLGITWLRPDFFSNHLEMVKLYLENFALMGLFLLAWSKEKCEDEMTHHMKLKAISITFNLAIFWQLVSSLVFGWIEGPDKTTIEEYMMYMLGLYLLFYYAEKWFDLPLKLNSRKG